jgi:hypothetical protein
MGQTMNKEELQDAIDDGVAVEVSSGPWRHGRRATFKVERDGQPYLVTATLHHEEGLQDCGALPLTPAKRVIVESWVPA